QGGGGRAICGSHACAWSAGACLRRAIVVRVGRPSRRRRPFPDAAPGSAWHRHSLLLTLRAASQWGAGDRSLAASTPRPRLGRAAAVVYGRRSPAVSVVFALGVH